MSVSIFLHLDKGIILISDVFQKNQCLVLAEIKVCQDVDCIVGKRGVRMSQIMYNMCGNEG